MIAVLVFGYSICLILLVVDAMICGVCYCL